MCVRMWGWDRDVTRRECDPGCSVPESAGRQWELNLTRCVSGVSCCFIPTRLVLCTTLTLCAHSHLGDRTRLCSFGAGEVPCFPENTWNTNQCRHRYKGAEDPEELALRVCSLPNVDLVFNPHTLGFNMMDLKKRKIFILVDVVCVTIGKFD